MSMDGVSCGSCGRDRSEDAGVACSPRTPCPDCNATIVNFSRPLATVIGFAVSLSSSLVPAQQDRDWRLRWQNICDRLGQVAGPQTTPRSGSAIHSAEQSLFEWFVSAYHLKDHLIAEQMVSAQDVEDAIMASPTLALLADLANLDKHRTLTDPPRSGDVPMIVRVADESVGVSWRLLVDIRHKGRLIDGCSFARMVVDEWRNLLEKWWLI